MLTVLGERRQEEKFREKVFEEKSQKKIQFQTAEFMTVLSRWWQWNTHLDKILLGSTCL